jgi:hypothetical protein
MLRLLFAAALFAANTASAQPIRIGEVAPAACTVAEVQAATCGEAVSGSLVVVTDAADTTECGNPGDAGGGVVENLCAYSIDAAARAPLAPPVLGDTYQTWMFKLDDPDVSGANPGTSYASHSAFFLYETYRGKCQPSLLGIGLEFQEIGFTAISALGVDEACKLCLEVGWVTSTLCVEIGTGPAVQVDGGAYHVRDPSANGINSRGDAIAYVTPTPVTLSSRGECWRIVAADQESGTGTCEGIESGMLSLIAKEIPE